MINLAQTVHDTFLSCLFSDGEDTSNAIIADSIIGKFGFHPERLEASRQLIIDVIRQMPEVFHPEKKGGGGGYSFLGLCYTKDNIHWAEHPTMNEFISLAFALNLGKFLMSREYWSFFPGGMPYLILDDEEIV